MCYENLIITDTDSCKLRVNDFNYWNKKIEGKLVPHWKEVEEYDGRYKTSTLYAQTNKVKVLGSFADEYVDKTYDWHMYLCKKGYMEGGRGDNNSEKTKEKD